MRSLVPVFTALNGLTAALAAAWLARLVPAPLLDAPLVRGASPVLPAALVLGAALVGLGVGLASAARRDLRVLLSSAVVGFAVFGIAVQGVSSVVLAGYLLALALPLVLVFVAVQLVCHRPWLGVVLALGVPALVGWTVTSGVRWDRLGRDLAGGLVAAGGRLTVAVLFTALAAGWVLLVVDAVRGTPAAERLTGAVVRHRRVFTVVAALGPLPYALVRATWLTPWPRLGGPITELTPEIRVWGVLLGSVAALGLVLTVGLVRPWGEVFPRWLPRWAGRPVPVALAAVPGGTVAAVLCVSAGPMLVSMLAGDLSPAEKAQSLVLFPFWMWGPALALAVWGYAGHRRRQPVRAG